MPLPSSQYDAVHHGRRRVGEDRQLAVDHQPSPKTGSLQSDTRSGWTVGGGIEYALGYGWSAKGEFVYVDFGNWNTFTGCTGVVGCPSGTVTNRNVNLKDYIWRAGLNYKFW